MNKKEFEEIFNRRVDSIRDLLITKASHYATDVDRMHNFKRAAAISGEHPCKALQGFLLKHITSYLDILDRVSKGEKVSQLLVDEKIGDILTYFFLQEALMYDMDCVEVVADAEYENEIPEKQTSSFKFRDIIPTNESIS